MHSEARVLDNRGSYRSYTGNSVNHDISRGLAAFVAHLNNSGKICLKPWCWKRFNLLFNPGFEPPWLSSWWSIPNHEKKDIFLKQLEYLVYRTERFDDAYQFLRGLAVDNWVYATGIRIQKSENRKQKTENRMTVKDIYAGR